MKRKAYLTGILGLLLVFAMVLTGCPGSNTEPSDTWADVPNVSDLAGSWEGKGTIDIPKQNIKMDDDAPEIAFPGSSMGIDMTFSFSTGGQSAATSITMDMDRILGVAAEAISKDDSLKPFIVFGVVMMSGMDEELSDANKTALLAGFGLSEAEMGALMGGGAAASAALGKLKITKDHVWYLQGGDLTKKYKITETDTILTADLLKGKPQLNQDSTKLKLVVPKSEFSDAGMTIEKDLEIILSKKQ
jgi:hypothetical protein